MLLPSMLCFVASAVTPAELMPTPGDYAVMSWADGWPGNVTGAAWLRCIRTGHYAFAMNTEALQVEHYGDLPSGLDYRGAATEGDEAWRGPPPGLVFPPWARHTGPRPLALLRQACTTCPPHCIALDKP